MTPTKRRALPKPAPNTRCAVLDLNGRQCRGKAVAQENYHGDHEIYSYFDDNPKTWVRIALCERHATESR